MRGIKVNIIFMYSIFTQDSNDLTCEALVASLSVHKDILDLEHDSNLRTFSRSVLSKN